MNGLLSFDDAPPYSVPLRFFLAAPAHGVLAGLLILWQGEAIYDSRWSPAALALTHLLVLGVLLQVMTGALFQFLPVAAGARIPGSARWAGVVHPALNLGVLALGAGFLLAEPRLLGAGGVLLAAAIGAFLFAALRAVLPAKHTSPTIPALKIALGGLLVAAGFGLLLLAVYGFGAPGRPDVLTAQHAAWGLVGWSALLVVGVSYVVVPMFQLTPTYRASFSRRLAPAIAAALVVWTFAQAVGGAVAVAVAGTALGAGLAAYAVTTLRLQAASKRPRADVTVRYWRLGMGLAIAGVLAWLGLLWVPERMPEQAVYLVGWLVVPGALTAVVAGMLCKIVPFLGWLHLQNRVSARGGGRAPHMGAFLPEAAMRRQFIAHAAALAALVGSVFLPVLTRPAGLLLALSFTLLAANLGTAVRAYLRHLGELPLPR